MCLRALETNPPTQARTHHCRNSPSKNTRPSRLPEVTGDGAATPQIHRRMWDGQQRCGGTRCEPCHKKQQTNKCSCTEHAGRAPWGRAGRNIARMMPWVGQSAQRNNCMASSGVNIQCNADCSQIAGGLGTNAICAGMPHVARALCVQTLDKTRAVRANDKPSALTHSAGTQRKTQTLFLHWRTGYEVSTEASLRNQTAFTAAEEPRLAEAQGLTPRCLPEWGRPT